MSNNQGRLDIDQPACHLVAEGYSQDREMTSDSQIIIDFIFALWSNRPMRANIRLLQRPARQTGGKAVARTWPLRLDLLALGSLIALLILARGAGTG